VYIAIGRVLHTGRRGQDSVHDHIFVEESGGLALTMVVSPFVNDIVVMSECCCAGAEHTQHIT